MMALSLLDHRIERVAIIDDKQEVRQSFAYHVEDLKLTPMLESGPMRDLATSVKRLAGQAEAALCDFQLRVSQYATFDGAELVAALYASRMPAVLCTRFEKSNIDEIRRFRHAIPCLLTPDELDDESLKNGFEVCIREFRNEFGADRRPWRALIRIQNIEGHYVYVIVPAWSSIEGLRLFRRDIPEPIASRLAPGFRCHAYVNLGATRQEDLFFSKWEA